MPRDTPTLHYTIEPSSLNLRVDPIVDMDVVIEVAVTDSLGRQGTASITAHTVPGSDRWDYTGPSQAVIPSFEDYYVAYQQHVGPWIEVDPMQVVDQGYRVDANIVEEGGSEVVGG